MAQGDAPILIELNPRERRLYDRLRARVVERRPGEGSSVRDMLLLLPDLAVLLGRLLREPRVPLGSKMLAVAGIGYLLSPIDLIPDALFGPIGLLDDLLVVGVVLSRMINRVHPDVVRAHWPGQGDALETVHQASAWAEQQITTRLRRVASGWLGAGGGPSDRAS